MLAPRHVIFTAIEGALVDLGSNSWAAASEALDELQKRRVPLVLVDRRTRAQLEPLRRKFDHGHPFITESGGGVFIPDGYFSAHLPDAERSGRYFRVAFGRPYLEAVDALAEIAAQAGVEAVGFAQMTAREIARNTNQSLREAELARDREFSERFFLAGAGNVSVARFRGAATSRNWSLVEETPFWEIHSGNDEARCVSYLMRMYRAPHTRLGSVAIGTPRDWRLLSAVDQAIVLPGRRGDSADELRRRIATFTCGEAPGAEGWNQAVLSVLART